MNVQLQKLAKKAGFEFWGDESWRPPGQEVDWSSDYDKELERLYLLILAECANFTDHAELMYKHFGVNNETLGS